MKFVNLTQHDRFRPLSGNKGNQRAGKHARGLSVEPVSVPPRGIRVINRADIPRRDQLGSVSVPSRGLRVINRMDKTKADLR